MTDERFEVPGAGASFDDLTRALGALRARHGAPSFTSLARAVSRAREARGVPAAEARVPRSTVYDCFRPGRRRLDPELVVDLLAALGADRAVQRAWRDAVGAAAAADALNVVRVHVGVPPAPAPLVGRETELAALVRSDRPTAIVGMAGVGKTSLMREAAERIMAGGGRVACLWVDGAGSAPDGRRIGPAELVRSMLPRLYGGMVPRGEPQELFRRALATGSFLIVVDDVADPGQIRDLIPLPAPSRLLVTSRQSFSGVDVDLLRLHPLEEQAAIRLLAEHARRDRRVGDEQMEWTRLVRATGRLPLALTLVGRRLAAAPDWTLADHATAQERQLELLQLDGGVEAALAGSYGSIPAEARRLLRLFAMMPPPVLDSSALAAVADGPAESALETLTDAHLVSAAPGGWGMHDLVQVYARKASIKADPPSAVEAAADRLLAHYVDGFASAVALAYPSAPASWFWLEAPPGQRPGWPTTAKTALAWMSQHQVTATMMARWAVGHGRDQALCRLVAPLSFSFWDRADTEPAVALQESAVRAAERLGDPQSIALASRHLGQTLIDARRFPPARAALKAAVASYQQAGDRVGEAHTRFALGRLERATGHLSAAHDQTSAAAAEFGRHPELAEHACAARFDLAGQAFDQERIADARDLLVGLSVEAHRAGWVMQQVWIDNFLGLVLALLGEPAAGLTQVDRALGIARSRDNRRAGARRCAWPTWCRCSNCWGSRLPRTHAAEEALATARDLAADEVTILVHQAIGEAAVRAGDASRARDHLRIAGDLARRTDDMLFLRRARKHLAALGDTETV